VVFSKTFISSEIKELLRPDLVALVESRDYSNIELLRLLSHKISLYVREFSNFFYISTDPVALEYATDEEIEAKQISEQNLGSSSFEVEEV
jgi:hypothetical protein